MCQMYLFKCSVQYIYSCWIISALRLAGCFTNRGSGLNMFAGFLKYNQMCALSFRSKGHMPIRGKKNSKQLSRTFKTCLRLQNRWILCLIRKGQTGSPSLLVICASKQITWQAQDENIICITRLLLCCILICKVLYIFLHYNSHCILRWSFRLWF